MVPIEINSFSSGLMLGVTLYRNQVGTLNKVIAQVAYALIAVIAATETVAACAFCALSLVVYPLSSTPFDHCAEWAGSSAFSIGWSMTDFILNLFVARLVADEKSARAILHSRNLMAIPPGAII